MKLLDHYSKFRRALHTCKCGWHGTGGMMGNGKYTGLGIDKHCPKCGEHHSFAKFSVLVADECRRRLATDGIRRTNLVLLC